MTKIALITGANRGIGYQTARLLGTDGMTVLLGARDLVRGESAAAHLRDDGVDARAIRLDVTDDATVKEAAAWVDAEFGRLDVLVNNAGIALAFDTPSAVDLDVMRQTFDTNVYGVIAVTNAFLPLLRLAPAGRIVNVSSEVGSIGSMMDVDGPLWQLSGVSYAASKAALNMVTAQYAKELWSTPIKVNAANPGYCATDFNGNSGFRSAVDGARDVAELALLGDDGPSGVLHGHIWRASGDDGHGVLPW